MTHTLRIGTTDHTSTAALQRRLAERGHNPGPVDGLYGLRTAAAVAGYQRAEGLVVDGVAGPETLGALGLAGAAAPAPDSAPATMPTGANPGAAYLTPLDAIAAPRWVQTSPGVQLTVEPLRDTRTGLYARLTYQGALDACAALGATLAEPQDIIALRDDAAAGRAVQLPPVTLPTVAMVRATGCQAQPGTAPFESAAQGLRVAHMRSEAWCRRHDSAIADALAAARWDGVQRVSGAGKHWVAGAPEGRAYLMGWWTGRTWIQPPPLPGSRGPHDRGHTDYATTTIARRVTPPADGAHTPSTPSGQVPRVRTPVALTALCETLAERWRAMFGAEIEPHRARMILAHWAFEHGVERGELRGCYCNNFGNVMVGKATGVSWFAMSAEEIEQGKPVVRHSRWRAYATPADGVDGYLRSMSRSFPAMLAAMGDGDALAVATAGKREGYFTAGLQVYAARLGAWYERLAEP